MVADLLNFTGSKNDLRYCPVCGFIETQLSIERTVIDFECPRCCKAKLSEYLILGDGHARRKLMLNPEKTKD